MQTTLTRTTTPMKTASNLALKSLGSNLHQLLNHAAMFRNYASFFGEQINDKNIKYILSQADSNMITTITKLCKALHNEELLQFANRKIVNSQRMLDLMEITEMCSRLNEESIAIVAESLRLQLKPILEEENKLMNKTN
jgi:hypothetical protein